MPRIGRRYYFLYARLRFKCFQVFRAAAVFNGRRFGFRSRIFRLLSGTQGLYFIALGILITSLPLLIVGIVVRLTKKMDYLSLCGGLSGCNTCVPSMTFVANMSNTNAPAIGYATAYPVTIALRVISAQMLALMLF